MKIITVSDIAPCSFVEVDRRFRDAYCLHQQGDENLKCHGNESSGSIKESLLVS
jgi:hypothetical protein